MLRYITISFLMTGLISLWVALFAGVFQFVFSWGNLDLPINVAVWQGFAVWVVLIGIGLGLIAIGAILKQWVKKEV